MPRLRQVQDAVDARLATFITDVVIPRQAAAFSERGKYLQLVHYRDRIDLPDNPDDANPAVIEFTPDLTRRAVDAPQSWAEAGFSPGATVPFGCRIDTYSGPRGRGWILYANVRWNGTLYERAFEGHEAGRPGEPEQAYGWTVSNPPGPIRETSTPASEPVVRTR